MTTPDLVFRDEGTLVLMTPSTPDGEAWVESHIPEDATMWGNAIVIEHRYAQAIYEGAQEDGLEVGRE